MTSECILLENALLVFVQNIVFLIKPICIQMVIKHEDRIKSGFFCLKAWFFIFIYNMFTYS